MVLTAILANKNLLGVTSEETKIITTEKATSIPDWNFMAYIAANNNLANFSITNIRQMIKVGSNSNINLIVQLDHQEERNISRYYLKKGEPLLASSLDFKKIQSQGLQRVYLNLLNGQSKNFQQNVNVLFFGITDLESKIQIFGDERLLQTGIDFLILTQKKGLLKLIVSQSIIASVNT